LGGQERLRAICLAFPEATEQVFGGHTNPTWRVKGKIFADFSDGDGREAVWVKGAPGAQAILVGANPDRFFAPPYVGPKGWIGIWIDGDVDWDEVASLIAESYRLVAPKKLAQASLAME
jgi:predicted DNA-binding protein (MmcQ/YjbR family)